MTYNYRRIRRLRKIDIGVSISVVLEPLPMG